MAFIYNIIKQIKSKALLLQVISGLFIFTFSLEVQAQYSGPPIEKDITLNIGETYTYGDIFSGESHWKCDDKLAINNLPGWMSKNVNSTEWKVKGTPSSTGSFTAKFKVQEYANERYYDKCLPSDSKQANEGAQPTSNAEDSYYVTLNITVIDDPPEIISSPVKDVNAGEPYSYNVVANDPEGQSLSYLKVTGPSWLSFTDNTLLGTPTYNDSGNHAIEIEVSDGTNYETQVYTLNVSSTDRAPEIDTSPPTSAVEGKKYNYVIEASDPDGDNISFSLVEGPPWLTLDGSHLHGTPSMTDKGDHSIKIQVTANGKSDTQSYTLAVDKVNQAPTVDSLPVTTGREEKTYLYEVNASDPDGDDLTYSLEAGPDFISFDNSDNILSGKPGYNQAGEYEVKIKVSDGVASNTQGFTLTINDVNRVPSISSSPPTSAVGGSKYKYVVNANDPDGDDISYSKLKGPDWLSMSGNTLTGTPSKENTGKHTVIIKAVDNGKPSKSFQQQFILSVTIGNKAPVFNTDPVEEVNVGEPYKYNIKVIDPDGDDISIEAKTAGGSELPNWLAFESDGGAATLAGTPSPKDKGNLVIKLTAVDNGQPKQLNKQEFGLRVRPKSVSKLNVHFVYPNACQEKCTIEFATPTKQEVFMKVYSPSGEVVRETESKEYPQGVNEIEFSPQKLPSGKYSFTIFSEDMKYNAEFTILR